MSEPSHTASATPRLPFILAGVVVALDQASKLWVLHGLHLPLLERVYVLPPVFNLTMVWNQGVSFGLLKGSRWPLVVFSAAVVATLGWWASRGQRPLMAWALGLVMGGAIGNNLIDRVVYGKVVDFLDFSGLHFPWVFNVADMAINLGVGLLILDALTHKTPVDTDGASKKA
jgi:signal peptidase II